jgi:hypothetical protein
MRFRILAIGTACLCMAVASPAGASYDPVGGGSTRLTIDKSFSRLLAAHGVTITTKAGARKHGRDLLLPVAEGSVDPTAARGAVENAGTLIFQYGRRRVVIRKVEVKTKREPLIAKVGGSQLKVATAGRRSFQRAGFASLLTAGSLRLTPKFATRLGKKLRLRGVFEAGQLLGSLRTEAQPGTMAVLPVGGATFAPTAEFLAKLDSLFVSLNPVAPAERAPGPVFSVPMIADGTISPDGTVGVPRTGGALEFLRLGSGQVFWQELWFDLSGRQVLAEVDVEPSPTLPGKVGQVTVASLGPGVVSAEPANRTVTIGSAPLSLSPQSAGYFNQAFGTDAFAAGEPIGNVSFTAQGQ